MQVIHAGDRKTIPTPALAENTFVLSDDMVVAPRNGRLFLMIRYEGMLGAVRYECPTINRLHFSSTILGDTGWLPPRGACTS
eukprot:839395-Pelagomonas_calceolata.AAC.4